MAKDTSGASAILKYSQIVYEIYQNFGLSAVLYHDENFWKTRQSPVIDWDHMDSELWLKASTIPSMPVQPYIPFELPPPPLHTPTRQDMPRARPAAVRFALRSKVTCALAYHNKKKDKENSNKEMSNPRPHLHHLGPYLSQKRLLNLPKVTRNVDLPVTHGAAALPAAHVPTHHVSLLRYPPAIQMPQPTLPNVF